MTTPSARPPNVETAAQALHTAAIRLLRDVRQTDGQTGLSPARLSALSVVVFAGPICLTDLAAAEHVTTATMSRLVQALERDGFVVRARDRADGRAIRLRPTAKGERCLLQGQQRRVKRIRDLLDKLPEEQQAIVGQAAIILQGLYQTA